MYIYTYSYIYIRVYIYVYKYVYIYIFTSIILFYLRCGHRSVCGLCHERCQRIVEGSPFRAAVTGKRNGGEISFRSKMLSYFCIRSMVIWQRSFSGVCDTRHTATHCSTLQHSATHCNTLQHTATHCNTLQHTAAHCNTLQHTATHEVSWAPKF